MRNLAMGPKITFVAALAAALAYWPAACAGRSGPPSAASGVGLGSSAPIAAKLDLVPRAFLPHPALAHAQGSTASVSIADIAERAAPSVVNVASSRTVKNLRERAPFLDDPFFRRFFGPGGPPEQPGEQQQQGLGSGVVVSADGLVLTNNHVVDEADEIRVTTADKREFAAKVVGKDAKSDVAVLRLQGDVSGLKPLEMGDSSRLRLGDIVLAIGNPFGVGQTITMGIVSAKGRANVGIAAYEDFIQTDAAINPGNSGGALVDMEGRLVGINTAILSRTGGSMGIGFAIPTNMARPIMKALLEHGKVVRGWLGVGIQDVDQELASAMHLPVVEGVLISDVMQGGPAAGAGLKSGDVVVKLDGERMESTGAFRNAIAAAGVGATVKLETLRDGKPMTLQAKLGELPPEKAGATSTPSDGEPSTLDGLTLDDLNPALRQRLDVPSQVKAGVVVTHLEPGSRAAASGLRPGDLILEVNRVAVGNVGAFKSEYAKSKARVLLRVVREGRSVFLVVKR